MKGFIEFVRQQGVVGLTIGFLLGGAVSKLVSSFINDIVNPMLGIFLGATGNLKDYSIKIGGSRILWGDFVSNLLDFMIIAAVVYFCFKLLGLEKLDKKKQ